VSVLSRDEWSEIASLVSGTWWKIQEIISVLSMLEIKGVVSQQEPGKYILT
jgi:predicted Rossmann fold nucleotide-binding protein DprA/Smf involved in DNA uptake